jgi:Reverse transcriptase (RNA-dependent DNA polymerase)
MIVWSLWVFGRQFHPQQCLQTKRSSRLSTTWACKLKSNGTFRARLNAQGFQQIPGVHYDPKSVAAPVTNEVTVRIVMTLMIMAAWAGELLDVKGAFLHGQFGTRERRMHMHVP